MARSRKTEFLAVRPSSSGAALASSGDDRRWKALTASGNAAFAAKRWQEAEGSYLEALTEADSMFRAWQEGQAIANAAPAPMLVVAIANLAECRLQGDRAGGVADLLVALGRRLCAVVECEVASPAVREQCFLQLRPMLAELVDKLPRAGWSEERTAREIERTKQVALRYLASRTTRH